MPMYANIDGAQKELVRFYANIDGSARELSAMYANIDGVHKMIFTSGEKCYTVKPTEERDVWTPTPGMLYYMGSGFTVNGSGNSFSLTGVRYGSIIHAGEIFIDDFAQTGTVLKQAIYYSSFNQDINCYAWRLDFGSDMPDMVGTAYSPDERGSFISRNHTMYVRTGAFTFYRWSRNGANEDIPIYWYRTYDTTPEGYDESTKITL